MSTRGHDCAHEAVTSTACSQAEAPPGAIFSKFKELIESSGAADRDIAFYFVHWLTDLGGAEGTPLSGAEKFVRAPPCYPAMPARLLFGHPPSLPQPLLLVRPR